ncbi:MAG: hypothetical protein OXH73_13495 [Caldilineaceae bacterium]|nr:hypothetical protein [Caldilineaceae bacterium]
MADNGHSDRLDRIEELIEANWKVIKANTELLTRMIERQQRVDERQDRMDERQDRTQEQLDQLSRDIGFLFASVQGHMAQPHPPAHAGENPAPPRSAGE